jgi:hypothetical protein
MDIKKVLPIRFNPLKHHRNYILKAIKENKLKQIIEFLDSVCNNYIDIYTGNLSVEEIENLAFQILKSGGVLNIREFSEWVNAGKGYRQIKLQNDSEWILRKSEDPEKCIHLHPARTGLYSFRLKASTFKTVLMIKTQELSAKNNQLTLDKVNQIRIQIGLSSAKKLERGRGILNCLESFFVQK